MKSIGSFGNLIIAVVCFLFASGFLITIINSWRYNPVSFFSVIILIVFIIPLFCVGFYFFSEFIKQFRHKE